MTVGKDYEMVVAVTSLHEDLDGADQQHAEGEVSAAMELAF